MSGHHSTYYPTDAAAVVHRVATIQRESFYFHNVSTGYSKESCAIIDSFEDTFVIILHLETM